MLRNHNPEEDALLAGRVRARTAELVAAMNEAADAGLHVEVVLTPIRVLSANSKNERTLEWGSVVNVCRRIKL